MLKYTIKALKVCAPFALGAGILWWMYHDCDWEVLRRMMQGDIKWGWIAFSLVFGVLPSVFRGLRWRLALDPLGEHPSRRVCIDSIYLSYAASLVIPRIGEVTRCGTLKTYEGTSFSKSLGTVVTERLVDSLLLLLLASVSFACAIPQMLRFMAETGMDPRGVLAHFTSTGYWVTALCIVLIIGVGGRLLWHLKAFERSRQFLKGLIEGVASLRHVSSFPLYMLLSVGIWVGYFLHFYITFFAFDFTADLSLLDALLIFCVGSFAVIVPTPNGAGPWHFAVKTMLVLCGVAEQPAVLFALVVHTIQTLLMVLLGLWSGMDLSLIRRTRQ